MKLNPLPFDAKDLSFWRTEIQQARQKREDVASTYGWDDNLKRYVPKPNKTADGKLNYEVNIGADFRDVERKKAALFYDTPQVSLDVTQDREIAPATPQTPPLMLSTLALWHQEILNELLGPQHANVKPTILKAIFNCLCPSGVGPVSVGYQVTMRTMTTQAPVLNPLGQPVMQPVDPLAQIGAVMGITPPPVPVPMMQEIEVEVPIEERWFVSGFSPKALLIPISFRDTDFQRAPWLGKDWRKPVSQVRREYGLPKDWVAGVADDEQKPYFDNQTPETGEDDAGDPYVSGVEITYRAQLRAEEEVHPDAMRQLVLVDGKDTPLVHRDSPYQDFTETGELTDDSLRGFVDRPLVLRDLSDSAWIPSDCAVTAALTKELEKFRTDSVKQRANSRRVILFDSAKIDPSAKDKIEQGTIGMFVPVVEGALLQGKDAVMQEVAQPSLGRETFMAQDIIERDREQILGIGANQSGVATRGRKTATEQTIVQRNSEARFEQERQRVLEWYLDVVSAFDTLVLRYADARIAVKILGEGRGQLWAQHKGALAGGYAHALRVDSGKYLDVEADRRQMLQFYNQVRQDPFINPRLILKDLAEKFGYDPAEFIVEPPKPQKDLKASVTIKSEMLDPALPQFPIMIALLRQGGWEISETDVQLAQQQALAQTGGMLPVSGVGPDPKGGGMIGHPGAAPKAPTINQHQADLTGDRSGPKVDVGSVM
jgi:hypothetical protein